MRRNKDGGNDVTHVTVLYAQCVRVTSGHYTQAVYYNSGYSCTCLGDLLPSSARSFIMDRRTDCEVALIRTAISVNHSITQVAVSYRRATWPVAGLAAAHELQSQLSFFLNL